MLFKGFDLYSQDKGVARYILLLRYEEQEKKKTGSARDSRGKRAREHFMCVAHLRGKIGTKC